MTLASGVLPSRETVAQPKSSAKAHNVKLGCGGSAQTHATAPTQYVEANGVRFACRRFGKKDGILMKLEKVRLMTFARRMRWAEVREDERGAGYLELWSLS